MNVDGIPRKAHVCKFYNLGVSYKIMRLIGSSNTNTKAAFWTINEFSEYLNTESGVKGCLLSPLLFGLFINDLHDELGGGYGIQKKRTSSQ